MSRGGVAHQERSVSFEGWPDFPVERGISWRSARGGPFPSEWNIKSSVGEKCSLSFGPNVVSAEEVTNAPAAGREGVGGGARDRVGKKEIKGDAAEDEEDGRWRRSNAQGGTERNEHR